MVKVWTLAARPQTLALSFTPVAVGAVQTALELGTIEVGPSVLFWIFAGLIQIGTNLHNDYADFVKGADTPDRVGQARATQKGWLTANQTLGGALTALSFAIIIGATLAHRPGCTGFMSFVTVSAAFNAVAYTGGFPLNLLGFGDFSFGYAGLGDIFVLLYFGYVATIVPFLLQAPLKRPSPLILIAATSMGFLATCVMVVNNLRDRITDGPAGKRTLAVRFGQRFARFQYSFLLLGAYALPIFAVGLGLAPLSWLLILGSTPIARSQLISVLAKDGPDLNPHVGGGAKLQLVFGLLLILAILLGGASNSVEDF